MGAVLADAGAGTDALGPYELPDPADPDVARLILDFVRRADTRPTPRARAGRPSFRYGWTANRPSISARPGPTPTVGRSSPLVSVCGPVNDRDCRTLLKLNARIVEGHFAIRVLRGEEYFVVIENVPADALSSIDAHALVRRIAELADGLEERLSR